MLFSQHTRRCLRAFYEGCWEGLAAPYYLFAPLQSPKARSVENPPPPSGATQADQPGDWQRIGSDLRKVISEYESTLQQKASASATEHKPEQ